MRILHLTTSFPLQPSSVSGIFIYRLVSHFPPEIQTVVLTPDSRGSVDVSSDNFRLQTFRYAPKQWQVLAHEPGGLPVALRGAGHRFILLPVFFISMLWSTIIQSRSSDVIHAHWTINGIIATVAGFFTRTPVITTLRGEDVNRGRSSLLHRYLLSCCLRYSDAIATVSSSMYKDLLVRFPEYTSKISLVPNGVSETFFFLPLTRKIRKATILILGSLIPRKGVDLVITALASGSHRPKEWKLIIAGTGPELEKLQAMVSKEGVKEKVKFAGLVSPEKVADLFAKSDILVQASYREGRPNSVLEAMAAGVAVVGSDIDGIAELIDHGKNGLLFPAGDAEKLSEQLQLLLDSPGLRDRLGQAGRQTLLDQNLTWPKCVAGYMSLYQRLVEGIK